MSSFKNFVLWTIFIFMQYILFTNGQCISNIPCFPPPIDVGKLVPHKMLINSTCGDIPEDFCVGTDCSLRCDANDPLTSHPGSYLIDSYDLNTYWKSRNFDEPVFIQCDFGFNLILHQITITFQFELPASIYIQRSQDNGNSFSTIIYFAIRCNDTFGMPESVNYNKLELICLRIDSGAAQNQISYVPRRDDYIATEVLKNGPVRDYFLTTNIRTVLNTFFMPSEYDRSVADHRKFYFAIRDIDIQASCVCNGMSNQCSPEDYGTCICQKNTDGKNCEKCKSLFNNKPWTFGQPCESCECYSHSSACIYDGLKKYGVCQNCLHNTMGDKCDSCAVSFYRNPGKQIYDIDTCISCNCFMSGVLFGSSVCNQLTGKCFCKSNVDGALCDTCKDGFYGLSATILNGCNACACSPYGTINGSTICNKLTGFCSCKAGFTGRTCSDCKPLYFSYPLYNPTECRSCNCDPSGSVNMTCDKSGQCLCRQNYFGSQCEQIRTGYFSASVAQLLFSPLQVSSPASYSYQYVNLTEASGNTFYVLGYTVALGGSGSTAATIVTFQIEIPKVLIYEFFLQYKTLYSFSGLSMQVEIQSQFIPYSCDNGNIIITSSLAMTLSGKLSPDTQTQSFGSLCLSNGKYNVVLWFPPNSAGSLSNQGNVFILSLLLMPNYESQARYLQLDLDKQAIVKQYYSIASSRMLWATQEAIGSKYLAYSYGSIYDQAYSCGCNSLGSINYYVCNIYGGQCNCKENIYGRTCMSCLPQYYNFSSGLGCVSCNCNMQGSINQDCDYNTGQCQCKPNVVGRTCNHCALQYYGISTGSGCKPCLCSALYATSSQCDETGQCLCKTGVGSLKCESCAPGFYDLSVSGCKTCQCNSVGTAGNKCNPTTGSCTCKELVMGAKCDQCTIGYYGFSSDFPNTCLKCYCSGKTTECDTAGDYYLTTASTLFSTTKNNVGLEGWTSVDIYGRESGKLEWDWAPNYAVDRGFAKLTDISNSESLFFSAPNIFLGNKRSLYMYYITFDLAQQDNTNPMDPTNDGDVIIKGRGLDFSLVMMLPNQPTIFQTFTPYRVVFYENLWRKNNMLGDIPTNIDMIQTLSDLQYIYIRGKWTKTPFASVGITNISITYSTYNIPKTSGSIIAKNVEYCNCPISYSGQFCQYCNDGYTRSPANGSIFDVCVPCQCNQHTNKCDPNTGLCFDCQDHTEGDFCETCAAGFYGDATQGNDDDCKECACPGGRGAKNQFSNRCLLDNDNKPTCIECAKGYSGRQCEYCSDGYYGNPLNPLGSCKKCKCNNNIDESAAGNCNTTTGLCLRCLFNTVGDNCEYCLPGYYGDALTKACKECMCDLVGSFGNDCQNITGYCSCKPNVIGRMCNKCAENTFNFESNTGCELCQCHLIGSASQQCDSQTGVCKCNPNVIGEKCDRCAPGYYDLSKGCLSCDCNFNLTLKNTTCDALTGQCMCIDSPLGGKYSGRTCNECAVNAIGTPPDCELCHSPCYDNWQNYIEGEVADINDLSDNITDLLGRFGNMEYEDIRSSLSELGNNLTYAMKVFTGGTYNTSAKDKQFKQIEMNIMNFDSVLNLTKQQLFKSKDYFETTIKNFDGSVSLFAPIPQITPISNITVRFRRQVINPANTIDAARVTQMAHGFITTTYQQNVSGQAVYSLIQNQYKDILSANESIADAASRLSSAMVDLSQSSIERSRANSYLDSAYKARFASNSLELMKIHDIVASVIILQNRTLEVYKNSLDTLQTAMNFISRAESESIRVNLKTDIGSQSASKLKMDAVTLKANVEGQLSVANNLKRTVDDVLYDAQQETKSLAQDVIQIAISRNKTLDAKSLSLQIQNFSLPITLADIQYLSNEIINTVVNEGVINETYNDAQAGLLKAQEVQERSQEAVDVSQTTLQDIKNLENSLTQSAAVRSSTQDVQSQNDRRRIIVQNITANIESEFSMITGQGAKALNMLSSAINNVENNKMCYVDAKSIIDNATATAASARLKATDASAAHLSNEKSLPTYATQINTLYASTSATHAEAKKAKLSADVLLNDVTEAERLKAQLLFQQSELDLLKVETETMEGILNNLILKYESERVRLSSCNQP